MKDDTAKRQCCPSPQEVLTLATTLSILLTNDLTADEAANLSNFINLLSVQVAVVAEQKRFCNKGEPEVLV